MRSGYKLFWSNRALDDLQNILDYLRENWTQKEIKKFAQKLEKRINLIQQNPRLFPRTSKRVDVRRSVLTPHTVIYYRINPKNLTIVTLFDTRRHPKQLKLK